MNVRKLANSAVEIEIRTHENARSANGACCHDDSLSGSDYELSVGRARFTINKMCMHFTDQIAAACESIYLGIGVDRSAKLHCIWQPFHKAAHLAIVGTAHSATATLATVVRIVRQVLALNIVLRTAQHELSR